MLKNKILSSVAGQSETLYSDDVFASYLRTGTGADATVTTGIDMTKGYMLWTKSRSAVSDHAVYDSARGVTLDLATNTTASQTTQATGLKAVSSTGHTVGTLAKMNTSNSSYVDWVFRKSPKFFDVVTYTGTGSTRTVSHSLGTTPGMIIVRGTSAGTAGFGWAVWHRSLTSSAYVMFLNTTATPSLQNSFWSSTAPTDLNFTVGGDGAVNSPGESYVAYLFAHDTSADGIIQCGSFTTDGSGNATVNLGWEPQYLIRRFTSITDHWALLDAMRGFGASSSNRLFSNLTNLEDSVTSATATSTGFSITGLATSSIGIYLAIRRPNKPPTTGTQVYENVAYTGDGASNRQIGSSVTADLVILSDRDATSEGWAATYGHYFFDRLRGDDLTLSSASTSVEIPGWRNYYDSDTQIGWDTSSTTNQIYLNKTGTKYVSRNFRRAPGFFDVVCYTGTGVARTVPHNLGVAPELMIVKPRSTTGNWYITSDGLGAGIGFRVVFLNTTDAYFGSGGSFGASPSITSTSFTVDSNNNLASASYVAYLFASLPGISKVGSYTGNGASQTINCGFTTGARFFLVKATSTTGNWWVYDSARGIVAAADPALALNTAAAEVTSADAVDPDSTGIIVNQEATCSINATGVSYIFLAIS